MLSVLIGLTGCRFSPDDIGSAEWENYQVDVLGKSVRFEIPGGGKLYRAPQATTMKTNPDGYVSVYTVGFGFDAGTGFGSKVQFAMQIKEIVGDNELATGPEALKRAVQQRGDYLSRRSGEVPVDRMNDFDVFQLGERQWVSLVNPLLTTVSTYFDAQHFLSIDLSIAPKYKPNARARMALDKLLLEIATRVKIEPSQSN